MDLNHLFKVSIYNYEIFRYSNRLTSGIKIFIYTISLSIWFDPFLLQILQALMVADKNDGTVIRGDSLADLERLT